MNIKQIYPQSHSILLIIAEDGRMGYFDVTPYLKYEAFEMLDDPKEFIKVSHGGYFVEWDCGADLSADTIEAHWQIIQSDEYQQEQCHFNDGICGSPNAQTRKVLDDARLDIDVYTATDINDLFQKTL